MNKRKHLEKDWSSDAFIWVGEARNEILLICGPGKHWGPPGGKKETNDADPIATLVREVLQETGVNLDPSQTKLLGSVSRRGHKTKKRYHLFLYEVTVTEAQVDAAFPVSEEHELVKVFTRTELTELLSTGNFSAKSARLAKRFGVWRT